MSIAHRNDNDDDDGDDDDDDGEFLSKIFGADFLVNAFSYAEISSCKDIDVNILIWQAFKDIGRNGLDRMNHGL